MDLNDPRIRRMLRSYEKQFVAERRFEELQHNVPDQNTLQKLLAPSMVPAAQPIRPMPAWVRLLVQPDPPRPQPALGRNLEKLNQINNFFSGIFETINAFDRTAAPVIKGLVEGLRPVADFLTSAGNFLDKLPKFTLPLFEEILEAVKHHQEMVRAGDAMLEAAEYGFADHLWNGLYIASFASVNPSTHHMAVTNKLLAATRTDDFGNELRDCFEGSVMMGRRWRVVEAALEAHQRREYLLSVPAMLPQLEGAIVDAMVLKGLTVKKNGKFYLRDDEGKSKQLIMFRNAVDNAQLEDDPTLEGTSSFLADSLVQRRNDILHGRDPRYGKAELSVQSLLVLMILAKAVGEIEENKKVGSS